MRRHRYRIAQHMAGFTLLEMLVAIAIFAMLSLAGHQVLQGVLRSNELAAEHSDRLQALQKAMLFMERDFGQMTNRLTRTNSDSDSGILQASQYLLGSDSYGATFVRNGWRNPQALFKRSGLQAVSYLQQEDKLIKRYFTHPDPVSGAEPKELVLLDGVESFQLRFFSGESWQSQWSETETLPQGVEMTLTLSDYGEIRRVFLNVVGEATSETSQAQEDSDDD